MFGAYTRYFSAHLPRCLRYGGNNDFLDNTQNGSYNLDIQLFIIFRVNKGRMYEEICFIDYDFGSFIWLGCLY